MYCLRLSWGKVTESWCWCIPYLGSKNQLMVTSRLRARNLDGFVRSLHLKSMYLKIWWSPIFIAPIVIGPIFAAMNWLWRWHMKKDALHLKSMYHTRAIISRGLYIFYSIFHSGLYSKAVNITDNLYTKQGYSSTQGL